LRLPPSLAWARAKACLWGTATAEPFKSNNKGDTAMINDLNRIQLMGRLGADAEQKSPKHPVTFSIATSSRWTDEAGDRHSRTDWTPIVVFNNLAKYAAKLKKGDRVYVEGELRSSKYDKTVGSETLKLTSYEVFAVQIERVATKSDDGEDTGDTE
jgi:single-strand DNA-binding protein